MLALRTGRLGAPTSLVSFRLAPLRLLPVLLAALVLAACDDTGSAPAGLDPVPPAEPDAALTALVEGVGGLDSLAALLGDAPDDEVETVLAGYGIGFASVERDPDPAKLDIEDCPVYFPASDRQRWIRLRGAGGSESHYIDGTGRPLAAYKRLPPDVTAPRSSSCQTGIGNLGSPASAYDGGHLIGTQLGGWGRRANIVPQIANFNRGTWKRVENALARCDALPDGSVAFYVVLGYPAGSSVVPSRWTANVSIRGSAWANARFDNAAQGGSRGPAEADALVAWIRGRGCV